MLILLYGPSGVGKTSVMRCLRARRGWLLVATYMTRQRRADEDEKITVTHKQFREMADKGEFFCITHLFGNHYGTPRAQIMQAAFSHGADRWVLDFAIDKKVIFSDLPHRAVILLPENWQQLETQLRKTGRAIRLSEVERDYYSHYRELQEQDGTQEILIVINREGLISEAVGKIEKRFAEGF